MILGDPHFVIILVKMTKKLRPMGIEGGSDLHIPHLGYTSGTQYCQIYLP